MKSLLPIIIYILVSSATCLAQPNPPGPPNGGGKPGSVPISGIEWLLLAGGLLGGKKAIQRLKSKKVDG
jgi:hypothetical protein